MFHRCLTTLILLAGLSCSSLAAAPPKLEIKRHTPANLFDSGEEVRFTIGAKGSLPEKAEVTAILRDETGKEVARQSVTELSPEFPVNFGKPGRGYFEVTVSMTAPGSEEEAGKVSDTASLGVVDFVNRTAEEVRNGKYVFGLKWWAGIHRQPEMMDAMCKLGLQWTRVIQNEGATHGGKEAVLNIEEIFGQYPMNAAIKVERFPKEAYDAKRYGPLEEYEAKWGRGHWVIKTVPERTAYTAFLKEQLKKIPKEQKVFEIWNEPWDKMSPEEFAEICQMVADIILEERPDAIIGPNLAGLTGQYEYDNRVIEAGGMKRMKMVALHPYSRSTDRKYFRGYITWLEEKLGRDMEVYITEYGSHNTPEGPQKQSDMQQARNIARRSVVLYSHGVQALVPHIAVSAEKNPTYWDDWLGLFRRNEEPKPAIIAHATAARMIDGSEILGDLWFGPEIEAMVFGRQGEKVLVLWTMDPTSTAEDAARKEIELAAEGDVRVTDILGREHVLKPENGKVKITLTEAPIYLTGFSPKLLAELSKELRDDRWPEQKKPERTVRTAAKLTKPLELDGSLKDWGDSGQFAFVNEAVNAKDASGFGYISWDEDYLWVGVDVKDNEVYNKEVRGKLYREDSVELFVSTEPRETGAGFGPRDHQFFLTPTSAEGKPVIAELTERESGVLVDVEGAKSFIGATPNGWALEIGIPWSQFKGFKPEPGARLMLDMRLNDADTSHKRWKLDPGDSFEFHVSSPLSWAYLELK